MFIRPSEFPTGVFSDLDLLLAEFEQTNSIWLVVMFMAQWQRLYWKCVLRESLHV